MSFGRFSSFVLDPVRLPSPLWGEGWMRCHPFVLDCAPSAPSCSLRKILSSKKAQRPSRAAVPRAFEYSSLPRICNLHRPHVLPLAPIEHFERVFVGADHAEHLFHGNVLP